MARDVLYEQTGTYFSKTRILSSLHELGFSFQKQGVKALEKKDKIEEWLNEVFHAILEEANTVGAKIYFEDESGISLNIFSGRSWLIKGQTPAVYRSGQRIKRTMAAAITPDGEMYFETYKGGTTAVRYESFLENLNNLDESTSL